MGPDPLVKGACQNHQSDSTSGEIKKTSSLQHFKDTKNICSTQPDFPIFLPSLEFLYHVLVHIRIFDDPSRFPTIYARKKPASTEKRKIANIHQF